MCVEANVHEYCVQLERVFIKTKKVTCPCVRSCVMCGSEVWLMKVEQRGEAGENRNDYYLMNVWVYTERKEAQ